MVKNIIVTQARVNSRRLPNKVMMSIDGETLLETHLNRLTKSLKADKVILATTFEKGAENLIEIGKKIGVEIFQGETDNVLSRFYNSVEKFNPEYIVRVTSDCPLIDPNLIDDLIEIAEIEKLDYVSNILIESYPDGQDIEVISYKALETCIGSVSLSSDKEHVTPYIKRNSTFFQGSLFYSKNIKSKVDYSKIRMTVDEMRDFDCIKVLIKKLGRNKSWNEYTRFIINNQNLFTNQDIIRNEGYLKSKNQEKK